MFSAWNSAVGFVRRNRGAVAVVAGVVVTFAYFVSYSLEEEVPDMIPEPMSIEEMDDPGFPGNQRRRVSDNASRSAARSRVLLRIRRQFAKVSKHFFPTLRVKIVDVVDISGTVRQIKELRQRAAASAVGAAAAVALDFDDREGNSNRSRTNITAVAAAETEAQLWEEIKVSSFTMLFVTAYFVSAVCCLLRVQLHILAREVAQPSSAAAGGRGQNCNSTTGGVGARPNYYESHLNGVNFPAFSPSSSSSSYSSNAFGGRGEVVSSAMENQLDSEMFRCLIDGTYKQLFGNGLRTFTMLVKQQVTEDFRTWVVRDKHHVHYSELVNQLNTVRSNLEEDKSAIIRHIFIPPEADLPLSSTTSVDGDSYSSGYAIGSSNRHLFLNPAAAAAAISTASGLGAPNGRSTAAESSSVHHRGSPESTASVGSTCSGSSDTVESAGEARSEDVSGASGRNSGGFHPTDHRIPPAAKKLLCQTWDILESPMFRDAYFEATDICFRIIFDRLKRNVFVSSTHAPLATANGNSNNKNGAEGIPGNSAANKNDSAAPTVSRFGLGMGGGGGGGGGGVINSGAGGSMLMPPAPPSALRSPPLASLLPQIKALSSHLLANASGSGSGSYSNSNSNSGDGSRGYHGGNRTGLQGNIGTPGISAQSAFSSPASALSSDSAFASDTKRNLRNSNSSLNANANANATGSAASTTAAEFTPSPMMPRGKETAPARQPPLSQTSPTFTPSSVSGANHGSANSGLFDAAPSSNASAANWISPEIKEISSGGILLDALCMSIIDSTGAEPNQISQS